MPIAAIVLCRVTKRGSIWRDPPQLASATTKLALEERASRDHHALVARLRSLDRELEATTEHLARIVDGIEGHARDRAERADALDEHVDGVTGNVGEVLDELLGRLPDVPKHDIAEVLGIDRRTLARWAGQTKQPPRRLDVVARLVAILRHNWTQEGIIAWFHRPRRELDGRTPLAVLSEPHFDAEALIYADIRPGDYANSPDTNSYLADLRPA